MDGPLDDVGVALAAAAAGVAVVRSCYGTSNVLHAGQRGEVTTDADVLAEQAILGIISMARPDDGWTGEEGGSGGGLGRRRWLVDPLCGTANFAVRTALSAVNVALVEGSRTLAAVSADPIAGEVFWTDGRRALFRRDGTDVALRPSARSRLIEINCDGPIEGPFVGPELVAEQALRSSFAVRVVSTTLAVAWVAAGRRAAYVSDGSFVDNVHYCAGIAICRAAGCVVTDLAGSPLEGGRGLVISADPDTHRQVISITSRHVQRRGRQ